ncbi:hypothetical protein R1sor_018860 [Riccia sorocarpa]|uniref:Uncharacterized protein n=1 Tax=Riccia sorocarpa TaxID=122646 RepID=A0ABD3IAX1_9MARC
MLQLMPMPMSGPLLVLMLDPAEDGSGDELEEDCHEPIEEDGGIDEDDADFSPGRFEIRYICRQLAMLTVSKGQRIACLVVGASQSPTQPPPLRTVVPQPSIQRTLVPQPSVVRTVTPESSTARTAVPQPSYQQTRAQTQIFNYFEVFIGF